MVNGQRNDRMKTLGGDELELLVPASNVNGQKKCIQGPPVECSG